MKLSEILNEDVSSGESIKHVSDILTTQLPILYRKLRMMAEKYAENHGEIDKGFNMVAGGQKAMWYNDVYFTYLKPSLYNLSRSIPGYIGTELKEFLGRSKEDAGFRHIETELLDIIIRIGKSIKSQKLVSSAETAKIAVKDYHNYIDTLNADDEEPHQIKTPKQANLVAKQNASIEDIVNDALSRIDKRVAGDIRNTISKSGNKLAALQQEFSKRGIKL